jgi:nucleoside-diphosphate-sugar epimerase
MRLLRERDLPVRMVSRSGRLSVDDAGVEVRRGDASDPEAMKSACEGASHVYFAAAPPYTDWADTYPAMQAGVMEGAASADAVLVTAENVYPYGKVDGVMTEQTPVAPCSKKGEIRARMSEDLLKAHADGKARVVGGRAPDYYGAHAVTTTVYGERVFYPALEGKAAEIFGDLDAKHTWIHVDDFARGLVELGDEESTWGQIWHLPCPPPMTQRQMLELIYEETGKPMKVRAMPSWMTPILGWFIPVMKELAEMQYQWQRDYRFSGEALAKKLGADWVTPHEEGVPRTVEWFRRNEKS